MSSEQDAMLQARPYDNGDAPTLVALMEQLGYAHSEVSVNENTQAIRERGGDVFVATEKGQVLGCVAVIIDVRLAEGVRGEIVSLVVSDAARGMGVGGVLVSHCESWLMKRSLNVTLRANMVREEAHLFYLSRGYRQIKSQGVFTKNLVNQ